MLRYVTVEMEIPFSPMLNQRKYEEKRKEKSFKERETNKKEGKMLEKEVCRILEDILEYSRKCK